MRKYIIVFLICFCGVLAFGQTTTSSAPELPKVSLPNPESFQFTKYGDLPISEYTGNLNYSVPIYNLKAANLELPITLSYNDAGIKVNDLPTKTGMTWVLFAGGVITRIIKDKPDEEVALDKRVYLNDNEYSLLNVTDGQAGASYLNSLVNDNFFDTEIDIFTYSFDNYSGSFYLDKEYNPVFINVESELKVLKTSLNTFTIITPNGVKYYFGGNTATETNFAQPQVDSPNTPIGNTAFYLVKIEHPINGIINLEYFTRSSTIEILGINESKANLIYHNYPDLCNSFGFVPTVSMSLNKSTQFNRVHNTRYISKISSPSTNTLVKFNYGNSTFKYILDNIEIKSLNMGVETLLNQVKFNYLGIDEYLLNTTKKRFFLQNIIFNNQTIENNKKEIFSFEYDSPFLLPDRLTFSQDFMGYYNGKINTTLLPKFDSTFKIDDNNGGYLNFSQDQINLYNNSFQGANRLPDFQYAKKGSLIKINYPTKGYTKVEYESYPVIDDNYQSFNASIEIANVSANTIFSSELPGIQPEAGYIQFLPIYKTQTVLFKRTLGSENNVGNHMRGAVFKILNVTDNIVVYQSIKLLGYNSSTSDTFSLELLAGKQYKFIVSANNFSVSTWQNVSLTASLTFSLITGLIKKDGLGLRVKKSLSYNHDDTIKETKTYYYDEANKVYASYENKDIPRFIMPSFITYTMTNLLSPSSSCGGALLGSAGYVYQAYYFNVNSNPISDILGYFKNFKNNKVVTISFGGDNFENGGVQKIFSYCPNKDMGSIALPVMKHPLISVSIENIDTDFYKNNFLSSGYNNNLSVLNGKLIKETYLTKKNNYFYKLSEEENIYENTILNIFTNFVGEKIFDYINYFANCNPLNMTSNYFLYTFKTYAYRNVLKQKIDKQYFGNTLLDDVNYTIPIVADTNTAFFIPPNNDFNVSNMLNTNQTFEYGTLRGLPTKITTTKSNGTNTSTVNTYVNQINSLSGITPADNTAYTALLTQNNVASPIQVQEYKNTSDLLSTQRTLYDLAENSHVLPLIIQTAKGNASLEDRIIFNAYDNRGNPTLVSQKRGPLTLYHYNLNNQVIAKIENFTGDYYNIISIPQDVCSYIKNVYPNSFVTVFIYDPITNLLIQTVDKTCQKTTYVYNALHRLIQIKDHNENVIKEFNNNYRP